MKETWRPVVGWEGIYEVSSIGRVRSLDRVLVTKSGPKRFRGVMLAASPDAHGYPRVTLKHLDRKSDQFVHRIVLSAFVGPCPDGMEDCHNDGDSANNSVENLRWDTSSANKFDLVRHGAHAMSRKSCCPRGHELSGANLVPSLLRRGQRLCLACNRAYSIVRLRGGDHRAIADQEFSKIVGAAA